MIPTCDACGITDDQPGHIKADWGSSVRNHYACCAAQGCETCLNREN